MTYRIYKGYGGTKCVRKFENLEDAQMWCWVRDHDEPYRIEWTELADEERGIAERKNKMFF
jgi:hypothetical protein